jgi:hypothetical protein
MQHVTNVFDESVSSAVQRLLAETARPMPVSTGVAVRRVLPQLELRFAWASVRPQQTVRVVGMQERDGH